MLCLKEIYGDHTDANMANHLIPVLQEYGLLNKVFCVVSDNTSSNGTMANSLEEVCLNFQRN